MTCQKMQFQKQTTKTSSLSFQQLSSLTHVARLPVACFALLLFSAAGYAQSTYQQGAAGSVARSVASKLQERVSVLDFGADPTGANDSTAAIQSALAAVSQGVIYFPAQLNGSKAFYRVSSIHVNRGQRLVGDQSLSSEMYCTSPVACITFGDNANGVTYQQGGLENFAITGNSPSSSAIGIYIGGDPSGAIAPSNTFGDFLTFRNIRMTNFGVGVQFGNNAYEDTFSDALILSSGKGVVYPGGLTNSGEIITFTGGSISVNGAGIENDGGAEFSLHGVALDYNGTAVTGSKVWLYSYGCHFEQATGAIMNITGGTRLVLNGNTYLLNSGNGSDVAMINISNSDVNAEITGGDAWSNHPVSFFLNAPNAPTYNLHIGGGLNVPTGQNIAAVVNPATAPGIITDLYGTMTVNNLVVNGKCTGCGAVTPAAPAPAVSTFNGRANAVVASAGDYSLDQIASPRTNTYWPLGGNSVAVGPTMFTQNSLTLNTGGSSVNNPAVLGFLPSGANGEAAQIRIGDAANVVQTASGYRMQLSAYWPIELRGNQQRYAPAFVPGVYADAAVLMYGSPVSNQILNVYESTGTTKVFGVDAAGITTASALRLNSVTNMPNCDASTRGMMYFSNGQSAADHLSTCAWSGNSYGWKAIF